MPAITWRERIKSGPLSGAYARARRAKRRLRGEPLAGDVPASYPPLPVEALRALTPAMPDHARLYYSLGLAYMEADDPASGRKALACLRCAEGLGFESAERIALRKGVLAAASGRREEALRFLEPLASYDLTADERALRDRLLRGEVQPFQVGGAASTWGAEGPAGAQWAPGSDGISTAVAPQSVVVLGDSGAVSANWWPDARYLLVAPEVTGLTPPEGGRLGLSFDLGIGSVASRDAAQAAGLRTACWLSVAGFGAVRGGSE